MLCYFFAGTGREKQYWTRTIADIPYTPAKQKIRRCMGKKILVIKGNRAKLNVGKAQKKMAGVKKRRVVTATQKKNDPSKRGRETASEKNVSGRSPESCDCG